MDFNNELMEIFDIDQIDDNDVLEDFEEYDSLAVLSIIALAESKYHKTITVKEIRDAATVGGLKKLVGAQ